MCRNQAAFEGGGGRGEVRKDGVSIEADTPLSPISP
jgi:hypothetical protein